MGENALRYRLHGRADHYEGFRSRVRGMIGPADHSAGTYWRRRFTVLVIGLSVFAMAAWSLSDALHVRPHLAGARTTARHGLVTGGAPPDGGPRGSGTSGSPVSPGTSASPGKSGSPDRPSGDGQLSPAPSPSASTRGFRGFQPAFCAKGSIVLSLTATALTYRPHQLPEFSLSVVSTQRGSCSFNIGSRHLALVIKEGPTRIWSSADCAIGTGSLVSALRRGVPTVVAISWNRKTSSPGCSGPTRLAPAGVYTGYAADGKLVSAPVTIHLS